MHDAMAMYYYASKLFSVHNLCSSRPSSPCEDTFAPSTSRHHRSTTPQQSTQQNNKQVVEPREKVVVSDTTATSSELQLSQQSDQLVFKEGHLVSGPLEALLQRMVPTADYFPDRAYLFAFLLSARLFMKPHELLGQICSLCDQQKQSTDCGLVPRAVRLLAEWTTTFPYDFRDERVMAHVRGLTERLVSAEPAQRLEVSLLLQTLLERLTALEKYEEFLQRISADASTRNIEALSLTDVTELCPSAEKLAQQLTHIELERLSHIGPEEFVQAFAKETPQLEPAFRDVKRTKNLENYVQWFNRLSFFVATEVCKHRKKKARVRLLQYWIEVSRECFNIGNFNSLMAILTGISMPAVARLKKTWTKVPRAQLEVLQRQMEPTSNFSSYRSSLNAAIWRAAGALEDRQKIVIPFFSLLLKDLYCLNQGCCSKLPNGHLNFSKFWELAHRVTEFLAWKQTGCPFEKDSKILTLLQASPVLTQNALDVASFECEPPETSHERERFKTLKAEMTST